MNNHTRGDFHRLRRFGRDFVRSTPEVVVFSSSRKPAESYPVRSHRFRWGGCREKGPGARAEGFSGMTHFSDIVRHPEKRDFEFKEKPSKKFADPSTALGLAERRGICWIQEKNEFWEFQQHTNKVQGNSVLSDLMTNVNRRLLGKMAALFQQHLKE